eukprot:GHVU01086830.1.p1 GENE.GHVU01086830.1~~GHVU01086830.1.p1  ORF type:complete len:108 (+),score=13.41 GHVU01086830.1:289-612(+)
MHTLTRSHTHSLTHSLAHTLTRSHTHSLTNAPYVWLGAEVNRATLGMNNPLLLSSLGIIHRLLLLLLLQEEEETLPVVPVGPRLLGGAALPWVRPGHDEIKGTTRAA